MRHAMWMGTRGYEMWVPTPKISPGYNRPGWSNQSLLLSGGVTQRSSKGAHNQYVFEWNNGSYDDVQPIRDMADGVYDDHDGVNLIYFLDPVAARRNLLPQHWATPALGGEDAPSLDLTRRPLTVRQAANQWRLPARSAQYPGVGAGRHLYVPIPPGFTAHFGWIGTGGSVRIREANAQGYGAESTPSPLDGSGTWTNATVSRAGACVGIDISLDTGATVDIRAMTLQILPNGLTPRKNVPWSAGQGNSGCQFTDHAGLIPLSVPLDLQAASATLEETGDWL